MPAAAVPRAGRAPSAVAAGLLQATSLPFIVTATEIGLSLGLVRPATGAALVSAGLLSVVLFPPIAIALLRSGAGSTETDAPGDASAQAVPMPAYTDLTA